MQHRRRLNIYYLLKAKNDTIRNQERATKTHVQLIAQSRERDIHRLRSNNKPNAPKIGKQIVVLQQKIDRLYQEISEIKAELIAINQANRKKNARPIAPMLPHQYAALAHCGDY